MPNNGLQIIKRNKSSVIMNGKKPFNDFLYNQIDSAQFYKSSENN